MVNEINVKPNVECIHRKMGISTLVLGRLLLLIGVGIFIWLFDRVYVNYLSALYFSYVGFYNEFCYINLLLASYTLSFLPGIWMPIVVTRPSQVIYWVLYLVIYIPSIIVPVYMGIRPTPQLVELMLFLFVGMLIIGVVYKLPLLNISHVRVSKKTFWIVIASLYVFFMAWIIFTFFGSIRFVSIHEIYSLRKSGGDLMQNSYVGYAMGLVAGFLNPFLMACGIYYKRVLLFIIGALGQVLLYGTVAAKSVLLSIVIIPGLFLLLCGKKSFFGVKITWLTVLVFYFLLSFENFSILRSLVFSRIFGFPGMLTALYHDFFGEHPLTFLSHVHGIDWVVNYPYANFLGIEVGKFYFKDYINVNAGFWATDGIAGFGLPGIVIVSVMCALVFWILDSVSKKQDVMFSALIVSFATFNIGNTSLFTSLITGGLGAIILMFYFMPRRIL